MKQYRINYMTRSQWEALTMNDDAPTYDDDVIQIVESKAAICMDIEATGIRVLPILRKLHASLKAAGYDDHAAHVEGWIETLRVEADRKYMIWNYSGDEDRKNGCWSYSWGIEDHGGTWYIFLNIAKPEPEKLHISAGNRKMGSIPSVSLMPVITCRPDAPCKKACYACRMLRYPAVKTAYRENTDLYEMNPVRYFKELSAAMHGARFFRMHVAGDIPDAEYLKRLVDVVRSNPWCEVLMFTKQHEIINGYMTEWGRHCFPENLHVILSNWGSWTCPNPYNLPTTDVIEPGAAIPEGCRLCGGNCYECTLSGTGCWNLKTGEKLVFYKH